MGLFLVFMGRLSPMTLPEFISTVPLAVVRTVRHLDCIIECSNAKKWNPHKILVLFKKKISKIDAQEPLKFRNSLRQIKYTCSVVKNPDDARFLDDRTHNGTCTYIICRSEFLNFKGSCASIFDIFCFK